MNQRNLYRTIESLASQHFKSDRELLKHVLNEIVQNNKLDIKGGRLWFFVPAAGTYRLAHQVGAPKKLKIGYSLNAVTNKIFSILLDHRAVPGRETDKYFKNKGIKQFAATGVGEKIKYKNRQFYQYVITVNAARIDASILSDLNIISLAINSVLLGKKHEKKAIAMERDLDKAREIQQSILPPPQQRFHHFDIYGVCVPDKIVGGDFFDYLKSELNPERLCIVVGDVASKGFRAASQAMYVVGGLRMGFSHNMKIVFLMSRLNILINQAFSADHFVSMFYAEFSDDPKGLVFYSNAGHNSPIVYRGDSENIELLESTGQILGPFKNERFRLAYTQLNKDDVMVIYTDGITEARNSENQMFGEQQLINCINRYNKLSAKEITENIIKTVQEYSIGSPLSDDKTVVTIKRIN